MHGADGLAGHAGETADQHHRLVRHDRRTGTWFPLPVGIIYRVTLGLSWRGRAGRQRHVTALEAGSAGEIVKFTILGTS
jgi:hypothetical protein